MKQTEKGVIVPAKKGKKNHIKGKLYFFIFLTLLLLLVAAFAKHICPYDPYAQDLLQAQKPPSWQGIFWERPGRFLWLLLQRQQPAITIKQVSG